MRVGVGADDRLTLDQQVCFRLAVASREIVSLYRPLLEPLGLTHPQYLVMVALWGTDGPVSVKRLSSMLQLEAPTLSPLLKRLDNAGLVERLRDPADGRSIQVSLTDRGRDLRARVAPVPAAIVEQLGMTTADLESLQDALNDVISRAEAQNARSATLPDSSTPPDSATLPDSVPPTAGV
jgi:DNA-binding MarR family transcriptional regulator